MSNISKSDELMKVEITYPGMSIKMHAVRYKKLSFILDKFLIYLKNHVIPHSVLMLKMRMFGVIFFMNQLLYSVLTDSN